MRFFTADTHFNHRRVISYCKRPFCTEEEMISYNIPTESVKKMNDYLVNEWNKTITNNDEIYILGDFSLNHKEATKYGKQLNGKKYLILGNHDKCFPFNGRKQVDNDRYNKIYQDAGFIVMNINEVITLKNDVVVNLSHLPPKQSDVLTKYDDRYEEYRQEWDANKIYDHGHNHGRYKKFKNMIDVGIDAHGLKILSEDNLINLINDEREFIKSEIHDWYIQRGITSRDNY